MPCSIISAKTGQRVERLFELVDFVFDQAFEYKQECLMMCLMKPGYGQPPSDKVNALKYIT